MTQISVINDMRCQCVDSICQWFGSSYGFSKLNFGFKKFGFALIQSWIMDKIAFNDIRWARCTFWKPQSCYLRCSHRFRTLHVTCSIAAVSPPIVSMTRPTGNSHLRDLIRLVRPECEKLTSGCANISLFASNSHFYCMWLETLRWS